MHVKLLLDENKTPTAAVVLNGDGVDTCHVRDLGLQGATDQQLLDSAYDEHRILITLNVGDFEKLVRARDRHAGVVLIEQTGQLRDEQIELVRTIALAIAAHGGALLNEVLRVAADGTMTFEPMTADND